MAYNPNDFPFSCSEVEIRKEDVVVQKRFSFLFCCGFIRPMIRGSLAFPFTPKFQWHDDNVKG